LADSGSILIIASSKGGVGKTTISICLAVNLGARGYRVAGVDADRNQAFATWHQSADSPPLTCSTCVDHNEIVGHIMAEAEKNDVVVVDTAGFENQTAVFSMGAADMVLIPVMADRNSVLEAGKTARQVASVSKIARRSIPLRVILTRWSNRGLAERATIEDLEAMSLPRLQQHLPDLSAFKKATFGGEVPSGGNIGLQIGTIIDDLRGLGAIAPKPARATAA
jgi:chromosome partitioning protein